MVLRRPRATGQAALWAPSGAIVGHAGGGFADLQAASIYLDASAGVGQAATDSTAIDALRLRAADASQVLQLQLHSVAGGGLIETQGSVSLTDLNRDNNSATHDAAVSVVGSLRIASLADIRLAGDLSLALDSNQPGAISLLAQGDLVQLAGTSLLSHGGSVQLRAERGSVTQAPGALIDSGTSSSGDIVIRGNLIETDLP